LQAEGDLCVVGAVVLFCEELQFVLFDEFAGGFMEEEAFAEGVDVVEEGVAAVLDGLDPLVEVYLTAGGVAVQLAHWGQYN
jgi:hypothetical protein